MKKINLHAGFTLVELLIVIAIIGILSSVVLVNLQDSRHKADDARREADMKAVRVALELYGEKNSYDYSGLVTAPPSGNHTGGNAACELFDGVAKELVTAGYLPQVPADPQDTLEGPACYHMWSDSTHDEFGTILAAYAVEWQKYESAPENRKAGLVVSKSGDTLEAARFSCADADFLFPAFNVNNPADCSGTETADFLLITSAGH